MEKNWEPKQEHQAQIARTIEFISDELAELQEFLNCPNSFIIKISDKITSQYKATQSILRRDKE